ncbi:hypothetical protein N9153_02835 [Planctomicrobium sp.]|jgi:hypothetical protein|nr:hypothetical protein [Planctomicrobium sp.]
MTYTDRKFSAFFCWLLVSTSFLVGISRASVAQDVSPIEINPLQPKQSPSSAKPVSELKSRLLTLSENILQRMNSEGITAESIADQRALQQELSSLLMNSATTEQQPLQLSTQDSGNDEESPLRNGSGSSSSGTQGNGAGEAAATNPQKNQSGEPLQLREKLADAVWGHLPPQERNDLIRTYSESYLPEYEDQVRNYFEKLAKLKRNSLERDATESLK